MLRWERNRPTSKIFVDIAYILNVAPLVMARCPQGNPGGVGEGSASFFRLKNPVLVHSQSSRVKPSCLDVSVAKVPSDCFGADSSAAFGRDAGICIGWARALPRDSIHPERGKQVISRLLVRVQINDATATVASYRTRCRWKIQPPGARLRNRPQSAIPDLLSTHASSQPASSSAARANASHSYMPPGSRSVLDARVAARSHPDASPAR
jgi:hypothetical protein